MGDRIGCLWTFRVSCFPWAVGSVVACFLSNIYLVILGRVFKGFSIGTFSSTIPIYINSALPTMKRGFALSVVQLCAALGTLFIYYVSYLFEISLKTSWAFRATWSLEALPTVFLCGFSWLLPESPHWCATKQKWIDAAETIDRMYTSGTKEPSEERKQLGDKFFVLSSCTNDGIANNESYGKLFLKKYCKYTLVGMSTQIMAQFTGISPLMYFFAFTCEACGLKDSNKTWFVSMQYVIPCAFNILPILFMDSCRRKDAMIYGYLLLSFNFFAMWLVVFRSGSKVAPSSNSPFDWELTGFSASLMLALYLFMVAVYSSLIQGFNWLYVGEIFPSNVKMKGISTCMAVSWSINLCITLISYSIIRISRFWIYIVFSALCVCFTISMIRFPETRNGGFATLMVKDISPSSNQERETEYKEAVYKKESKARVGNQESSINRELSLVDSNLNRKVNSTLDRLKSTPATSIRFSESTAPIQVEESSEIILESPRIIPKPIRIVKTEEMQPVLAPYLTTGETFGSRDESSFYSNDWNSGLLPSASPKTTKRANAKVETSPPVHHNQESVWWNRNTIENSSQAIEREYEVTVPRKRFGANRNTMTTNVI